MFALEQKLSSLSDEERYEKRLSDLKSLMETYFAWIEKEQALALPKSSYGKAVKDGRLELSNNRAERAIKPFVIRRKNWLFTNTPAGAHSSAIFYSIIETAKENGFSPFEYLRYLFEKLPNMDISNIEELDKRLPWSKDLPTSCIGKKQ